MLYRYLYKHIQIITRIERGQFLVRPHRRLLIVVVDGPAWYSLVLTHRQARRKQIQWSRPPVRRATSRRIAGSVLAFVGIAHPLGYALLELFAATIS